MGRSIGVVLLSGVVDQCVGLIVSHCDIAPVDQDIGAGDEARAGTAQEQEDAGDFEGSPTRPSMCCGAKIGS